MADEAPKQAKDPKKPDEIYIHPALDMSSICLDNILTLGRTLSLEEEVDSYSMGQLCRNIRALDKLSHEPIYLWINSPGGNACDGLALIDTMRSSCSPIITIVNGTAASMAFVIAICGDVRLMTENSYMMFHPMSGWARGYLEFMKDSFEFSIRLNERIMSLVKTNSKLTVKQLEKVKNGELWLDVEQCKKYCAIDGVYFKRSPMYVRTCDKKKLLSK